MSKLNGSAKSGDCKRFTAACSQVLRIAENVSSASETSNELNTACLSDSVFDKTERSPHKSEVRRALVFSSSSSTGSTGVCPSSENDNSEEQDIGENEYGKELFPSEVVDYMITLIEVAEKDVQARKHATMNVLYEGSAEFASLESLDEKLRSIRNLNTHLVKIIQEADLLKTKLQNPVLHNALHINMCYHRFVLDFFQFATTMINQLESNKVDMDWIHCKNFDCFRMEPLLTNLCDNLIEKQKTLDSLEEFCSNLQKLWDLTKNTSLPTDSCNDTDH